MQNVSGLTIEITLASPGVFRVIERSLGASSAIHKITFDEGVLAVLIAETHRSLFAINTNHNLPVSSFRRLGAQIAALVLPPEINGKVEQAADVVGFYLDDYSLKIPVEILPCQDSVLADKVPVIRHWLYDADHFNPGKNGVADEKAAKNALLVADPAGDLPSAAAEGQSVLRFLKEKKPPWRCRYLGHSVTADAVTHELPDTELFHIAAHYHDGSEKERHGIAMSDGFWLPDRIPHTPDIVFLNCCRAGQVDNQHGNQSLIGKFLQQGTQHIIAPFLPTSDVIAKRFADEFYRVFDKPDTIMESVLKARQALGAVGLLYLHYGTQVAAEILSTRQASSKYRGLLFTALLAMGCALLAVSGTLEYQKHRSSREMEQQLTDLRLQAAQDTERQLEDLRLRSTQEMERQLKATRQESSQETERRLDEMRRESTQEMERQLAETRRQSAQETEQQLKATGEQSAQETERRLAAMRLESTKEMERQLEEARHQSVQETERQLNEARLQSEQETERRIEQMRLQYEKEMEQRLAEVRQQSAQEATRQIEAARIRAEKEAEEWLEQERLQMIGERLDKEDASSTRIPGMMHTLMGKAAKAGDIPVMALILSRDWPIDGFDEYGKTAFGHAVEGEQLGAMKWLKEQGADIHKFDKNQSVPLHFAAYSRSFPVMEWLLENGEDVNVRDPIGSTAMMRAANEGHVDVMQWLHDRGAEVAAHDLNGNTAMMYAAHKDRIDAMQWLYNRGANVSATDTEGRTPLAVAEEWGRDKAIQWLKKTLAAEKAGVK